MILETLYKRTKTGAIQYYIVSVPANNLAVNDFPFIRKESGQLGTSKPIIHEENVPVGKQKRTPLQQAESQAQSDWTRKHDEGYKSLADLSIIEHEGYVSCNGQDLSLTEMLEVQLPQFNTDASGNVKPMLAKEINWKKVTYPCYVQPKLDGVRALLIATEEDIIIISRSGKKYTTVNHIADSVVSHMENTEYAPFILDGEIYSHELSFQEIIAAVKKERPDSLKLCFRAYDIVNDMKQHARYNATVKIVDAIDSKFITMVETLEIYSKELVENLHDDWVAQGYEGAMVRLQDGKYAQGQRSWDLMKVKQFDESEFAFKNFEFGQRGVEDLVAVCWDATGEAKEFRAKMVGTKAQKEELYALNDISEGKSMTIKHFGYTTDGLPRFPIGKGFRLKEDT